MCCLRQVIFETLKKKIPPFWLCPALDKEAILRTSSKSVQGLKTFVFKACPECKPSLLVFLAVLVWSGRKVANVLRTDSQMCLSLPVEFLGVIWCSFLCWTVTWLFECCLRKHSEPFSPQMLKFWWCFHWDTGFVLLDLPVSDRWA